ncbi:hypothetical protein FA13DRAFT_1790883 [Coprinellus micaceus]|uniref:Uncharacterized protein n=1 Tax=Coprinellus micaceus TaxID=71717 RepID=A0A4Y7TDE8_COPMI|nr:hypothetical protein FA13DRAFT_1790883 [Coprinellus micaceus]
MGRPHNPENVFSTRNAIDRPRNAPVSSGRTFSRSYPATAHPLAPSIYPFALPSTPSKSPSEGMAKNFNVFSYPSSSKGPPEVSGPASVSHPASPAPDSLALRSAIVARRLPVPRITPHRATSPSYPSAAQRPRRLPQPHSIIPSPNRLATAGTLKPESPVNRPSPLSPRPPPPTPPLLPPLQSGTRRHPQRPLPSIVVLCSAAYAPRTTSAGRRLTPEDFSGGRFGPPPPRSLPAQLADDSPMPLSPAPFRTPRYPPCVPNDIDDDIDGGTTSLPAIAIHHLLLSSRSSPLLVELLLDTLKTSTVVTLGSEARSSRAPASRTAIDESPGILSPFPSSRSTPSVAPSAAPPTILSQFFLDILSGYPLTRSALEDRCRRCLRRPPLRTSPQGSKPDDSLSLSFHLLVERPRRL